VLGDTLDIAVAEALSMSLSPSRQDHREASVLAAHSEA
jgi:hypothetical protein